MRVISVEYLKDYQLKITFSNGKVKVIDFKSFLLNEPMYKKYRNIKNFQNVKVVNGLLSWNDELDFSSSSLYNWKD